MKKAFLFLGILCIMGCQNQQFNNQKCPKTIEGTWKSEKFNWVFTFNKKNELTRMVHTMGIALDVSKGGRSLQGKEKSEGQIVLGPCTSSYMPKECLIKVNVDVDYFYFKLPAGTLEGLTKDWFVGHLNNEDESIADWYSYGEMEGSEIKPDINSIKPQEIVFKKVN